MIENHKCLAVIRVRGESDILYKIKDTLKLLNLSRNYHATLIDNRPSYLGMLRKAQHCLTWGEVTPENITLLLKKRGKIVGNKKINDEYAKEIGFKSIEDLAKAIHHGKTEFKKLPNIKPLFRLHPPKKGLKGKLKKSFIVGGTTGYRGKAINDLIMRMV